MTATTPAIWFNGVRDAAPPATSRGLHYGDGVFRTMLLHDGRIVDEARQLAKLAADAGTLDLVVPDGLRADLAAAGDGVRSGVVKLLLLRAGEARGYRPQDDAADRLVLRYPLPDWPARNWREGIVARRSPVVLGTQRRLAGVKHLNRLEQVLASRDWPQDTDETILCDAQGQPVCGTRSNLFWVRDGVLHTPALDRCGVAGMMRAKLMTLAAQRNLEVRVGAQPWSALAEADEAFVCNSLIGLWPLRALDARSWPASGPVTADLLRALAHPTLPP